MENINNTLDERSIFWFLISMIFWPVGIIAYFYWNPLYPKKRKSIVGGLIVALIFYGITILNSMLG